MTQAQQLEHAAAVREAFNSAVEALQDIEAQLDGWDEEPDDTPSLDEALSVLEGAAADMRERLDT